MYPYYYDDSPLRSGRPRKVRNPDLMPDEIADGSVTTPKIADGAVTEQKLADGSVSLTKMGGTVFSTFAMKSDLTNFAPLIVADNETTAVLLDSLGYTCETRMPDVLSQSSINIAERMLICWMYGTVLEVSHLSYHYDDDTDQMVAFSRGQESTIKGIVGVDSTWTIIDGNDITILDGAVTESKVANNAITTNKIADNSITTNKIVDNSVTADKLSNNAIPTMSASVRGIAKVGAGLSMNGDALELDGSGDIATAVTSYLNAHPEATTTVQPNSIGDDKLVQTGGVLEATKDLQLRAGETLTATKPPTYATTFKTLEGLTLHKGCAYELTSTGSAESAVTSWNLRDSNDTIIGSFPSTAQGATKQAGFMATEDVYNASVKHWGNSADGTYTDTIRLVYDSSEIAKGSEQASMSSLTGYDIQVTTKDFYYGSYNATGYVGLETKRICTAPMLVKKGAVVSITAGTNGLYCAPQSFEMSADGTINFASIHGYNFVQDGSYTIEYDGYMTILAANAAGWGDSTAIVPSDFDSTVTIHRPYSAGTITAQNVLEQSFNSAYHEGATDFVTKCQQFSALMYGDTMANVTAPSDIESFLFFTDPHLAEFSGWEDRCMEYIAQIQKYYNSTPTTFCLCGGDWLGNSDLPAEACFKMGYIDGFMHSMFDNCYMLVGNHDTNYQGKLTPESQSWTTRLSDQSIRDLWYRGGKAYYDFNGANTRFFCFDTGVEVQTLTAYDNYGYEQAHWFAEQLGTNTAEHVAIAAHILYYNNENVVQPLTQLVLDIAQAFNSRTSITFVGSTYNFANATGKVESGIFGHTHADSNVTINGIPCVVTTWVRDNENYGPTFDLVLADYTNSVIRLVRVGHGEDRTVALS